MSVPLRNRPCIARSLRTLLLSCSLAACGSRELPSDPVRLAQTAQARLAAGRVDDARRCAERLLEQSADAQNFRTGSWLLARCTIAEARDEIATIVELIALQREQGEGLAFELSALARDEMAVLLSDCRDAGRWRVERWLLGEALAGERLRGVGDAYTQALDKRVRRFAPCGESTSIHCDW